MNIKQKNKKINIQNNNLKESIIYLKQLIEDINDNNCLLDKLIKEIYRINKSIKEN